MKSEVFYLVSSLKKNNEIDEFIDQTYLQFYKDTRYIELVKQYGIRFNIKNPCLYYHDMSTYEFIKRVTYSLIKSNIQYISCNLVISECIDCLGSKNIRFSVLDSIMCQELIKVSKGSDLYLEILSRNVVGTTASKYMGESV